MNHPPPVRHEVDGPKASGTAHPTQGIAPATIYFTGSGTDTNGSITSYHWDFGDGTTSEKQNTNHTYHIEGMYQVHLIVTSNDGAIGLDTIPVIIENGTKTPPVVVIYTNTTQGTAPLTVLFTGYVIHSDAMINSYYWDFNDGSTSDEPKTNHTFAMGGTYLVNLTVTDVDDEIGTTTVNITVEEPTDNYSQTNLMTWLLDRFNTVRTFNQNLSDFNPTNSTNSTNHYRILAASAQRMQALVEKYMTEIDTLWNMSGRSGDFGDIKNGCKLLLYNFKQSCYYTQKGAVAMLDKDYVNASYYFDIALNFRSDTMVYIVRITSLLGTII